MKQPLLFLLFLAGFSLSAQPVQWTNNDSINLQVVKAAFQKVIEWDGDTSLETTQNRALLADELWAFYQENPEKQAGEMALFNSFAISLRNGDQSPIISRFEKVKPNGQLWTLLYPFYKKALAQTYTYEQGAAVLKNALQQAETPEQRIQLNYDIGYWAFYEGKPEEAEPYFQQVLELAEGKEQFQRQRSKAASYLQSISQLGIGNAAPDFTATDINGREISLQAFKGKVILLDFWASWCVPCREELPALKELYNTYHKKGLEVISISLDREREQLEAFISKENMNWTHLHAPEKRMDELVQLYNGFSLPTYYIIDRQGTIRYNYFSREAGESLEHVIVEAIKE